MTLLGLLQLFKDTLRDITILYNTFEKVLGKLITCFYTTIFQIVSYKIINANFFNKKYSKKFVTASKNLL